MVVTLPQEVLTQETRQIASRLLHDDQIAGAIGLRAEHNHIGPHLFTLADDLEELTLEPRYPLANICQVILSSLTEGKVGIIIRGCDERALIEMTKLGACGERQVETHSVHQ